MMSPGIPFKEMPRSNTAHEVCDCV